MNTKIGLVMAAAVFSGTAFAQLPQDTDGDGLVSREEFMQRSAERFARLDANGDGYLSLDEMRAMRQSMREGMRGAMRGGDVLRDLDADGDGALSLAEIQARRPEMSAERFNQMDRNGDGLLTPDERPIRRPGF